MRRCRGLARRQRMKSGKVVGLDDIHCVAQKYLLTRVRSRKITEQGQQILRRKVHRGRQLPVKSMTTELKTSCGLQISSKDLHGMGFHAKQLHPSITLTRATQSVRCSGVKDGTTGLYSSGDLFSTVTNHAYSIW